MTSPRDRTPILTVARERWVTIVLVVVTISFVAQNRNRVDLNLFWMHLRPPLWLVMTIMAVIGAVIGWLASRRRRR
ncbi:MAG: LapA family protein [Aeromicrobium sp.]